MRKQKTHHYRALKTRREALLALLLLSLTVTEVAVDHGLHASLSSSQSVCVGVSVIGLDNGDPGTINCSGVATSAAASSASSSSVSSASSSQGSSVVSSQGASSENSSQGPPDELRHDPTHIDHIIAEWVARQLHPAAPARRCGHEPYDDVPIGAWFEAPVSAFKAVNFLDRTTCIFRPADFATRAEFAKLLVSMSGGILHPTPASSSFVDVEKTQWYFPFTEEAAKRGWMLGDDNCYGRAQCIDMPAKSVTRAEAAQMIVRFFHFTRNGYAAEFVDNPPGLWYTRAVQIAADHCILQGDDAAGTVRPMTPMNRAEMVSMLARAELSLRYGLDCGNGITSRVVQHGPAEPSPPPYHPVPPGPPICSGGVFSCMYEVLSRQMIDALEKVLNLPLTYPSYP
jgi:hypothetical protein